MPGYFDRGQIIHGGGPIAEIQQGSVEVANGSQDVVGLAEYLGISKGAVLGTVTVKRAVPRAGFQDSQAIVDAVINQSFVSIVAINGGRMFTVTGVPKATKIDFGNNSTSMEDFSVHGKIEVKKL